MSESLIEEKAKQNRIDLIDFIMGEIEMIILEKIDQNESEIIRQFPSGEVLEEIKNVLEDKIK
jgi:hypothetical protein